MFYTVGTMAGRPTKYRKEFCDRVPALMAEGASIEEVAAELGVSKVTLYAWTEKHKPFMNAIKNGAELSKAWWLKQGRVNLWNRDFQYGGWFMNMKNRHGWADKKELSGKDGAPVKFIVTVDDD